MNNHQLKAYHALTWYEDVNPNTAMEFACRLPKIRRLALKYDRAQVTECNGGDVAEYFVREAQRSGDWTKHDRRRNESLAQAKATSERIEKALKELGAEYGLNFKLGGDPRGFTVRLMAIKDGNRWRELGEHGTIQQTLTEA